MTFQIPGYTPVFADEVFESLEPHRIRFPGHDPVDLNDVLILGRYENPTVDEIVDYLLKKAVELKDTVEQVRQGHEINPREYTGVEISILRLPKMAYNDMLERREDLVRFLAANSRAEPHPDNKDIRQFLKVKYGLVPTSVIGEARDHGDISDSSWYHLVMKSSQYPGFLNLGEQWTMKIPLKDSKVAGDAAIIYNSPWGIPQGYARPIVNEVVRALPDHGVPFGPKDVVKCQVREEHASYAINTLMACIATQYIRNQRSSPKA